MAPVRRFTNPSNQVSILATHLLPIWITTTGAGLNRLPFMVSRIAPKNPDLLRLYLRQWREYAHLTQEELADAVSTTKGTVSRMETGSREPNLGYLAAFAEATGCHPADLFRRPGEAGGSQAHAVQSSPRYPGDVTEEEFALAIKLIRTARRADK